MRSWIIAAAAIGIASSAQAQEKKANDPCNIMMGQVAPAARSMASFRRGNTARNPTETAVDKLEAALKNAAACQETAPIRALIATWRTLLENQPKPDNAVGDLMESLAATAGFMTGYRRGTAALNPTQDWVNRFETALKSANVPESANLLALVAVWRQQLPH